MHPITRDQYHAEADIAIHDLGGVAQSAVSADAMITIRTIMDPSESVPWLTRRTHRASGRSTYFRHDTAPRGLGDTPPKPTPVTTRVFRRHTL